MLGAYDEIIGKGSSGFTRISKLISEEREWRRSEDVNMGSKRVCLIGP